MSDIPTTHPTTTDQLAARRRSTPRRCPGAPFATVAAAQLRVGDLIHRPAPDSGHAYVLVARAVLVDGLVQLMLHDSDHPHGAPATYRPADDAGLLGPDRARRRPGREDRAHRRGAAFALIDQISARSVGLPPVAVAAGGCIEDEIYRTKGRDPLPPRVR